jgi:hypothetical protein
MLDIRWFKEYEKEFSESRDKGAFFDKYYDPDAEFIHPFKGRFKGKQALVNFWNAGKNSGHAGIHEVINFRSIVVQDHKVAAELDIQWNCFEDTDYLGPRKKGDVFWGKCAAFYRFKVGKIVHVQLYLNLV